MANTEHEELRMLRNLVSKLRKEIDYKHERLEEMEQRSNELFESLIKVTEEKDILQNHLEEMRKMQCMAHDYQKNEKLSRELEFQTEEPEQRAKEVEKREVQNKRKKLLVEKGSNKHSNRATRTFMDYESITQAMDGSSGDLMHKNHLQEYAQRSSISLPVYRTVNEGLPHAPMFKSTVKVDGTEYTSVNTFSRQKLAEQDVAKIAWERIFRNIQVQRYPLLHQAITHEEMSAMNRRKINKGMSAHELDGRHQKMLEEDSLVLQLSVERDLKRKLLILDLNGLLCDISHGCKAGKKTWEESVFKRPFCDDFLKFCFERFEVGVWTSRIKRNMDRVVDLLMGDMKHELLFCWDQFHCTMTNFKTIHNKDKPLMFKNLRKLWDNHDPSLPWKKGQYNQSNTLLLDDSPCKALLNPPNTAIFPYSYRVQDNNDDSLGPTGDIRRYLDGLAGVYDVQEYVEQHPFGQPAISNTSSDWRYYSKIVEMFK